MSDRRIPVDELAREWRQDPDFRAEYEALDDEFALATALIGARTRAALTPGQRSGFADTHAGTSQITPGCNAPG